MRFLGTCVQEKWRLGIQFLGKFQQPFIELFRRGYPRASASDLLFDGGLNLMFGQVGPNPFRHRGKDAYQLASPGKSRGQTDVAGLGAGPERFPLAHATDESFPCQQGLLGCKKVAVP